MCFTAKRARSWFLLPRPGLLQPFKQRYELRLSRKRHQVRLRRQSNPIRESGLDRVAGAPPRRPRTSMVASPRNFSRWASIASCRNSWRAMVRGDCTAKDRARDTFGMHFSCSAQKQSFVHTEIEFIARIESARA